MYKIPDQVEQFIEKNMETWGVELTTGGQILAEVKIQRGIFQGDVLSPFLYVIAMMPLNHTLRICTAGYKLSKSQEKINYLMYMDDIKLFAKIEKELEILIQTVRMYSQDIGMEFGMEKYTILVIKSSKRHMTEGAKLPDQVIIRTHGENETYKYLGILEADTNKQVEMKEKIKKEYLRRTRKLLKTKHSNRNLAWAVLLVRYSGPFLKWAREELKQMDKKTNDDAQGIAYPR